MTQTSARRRPLALILISVLSLVGVGLSIALSQHFYELRGGGASFHSYCNVGASMNCDVVAASRYAEIFMGLPLSSFAGGWFLGMFLVAVLGYNIYWRRETTRALFAMAGFGLICSVVWFVVMAAIIKTYCLLCLLTDGISVALFGAVLALKPEGFGKNPPDAAKWKPIGLIVAGSLFATVIGLHATLSSEQIPADTAKETVDQVLNSPVL
ncbi:MAG: vitamin K epoxide reductase family protein, partial [Bdellovibrionota bacterium]